MLPNRRFFLRAAGVAAATTGFGDRRSWGAPPSAPTGPLETFVPMRTITHGPKFHWFGYYDKQEFDPTGRYVLTNQVDFEGRSPTAEDFINVGIVDTGEDGTQSDLTILGRTNAWGWQQGCMLQFVGPRGDEILWNDRQADRFVCRIMDQRSGDVRTINHPIYTISPDGQTGLSVDFRRIDNLRPGYGYDGLADPHVAEHAPAESGIWRVDLRTGQSELILSLADVVAMPWPDGQTHDSAWHYFNHLLINPAGDRFIVLHRFRPKFDPKTLKFEGNFVTRMLTADLDGRNVHVLDPSGHTSHFIWKNSEVVTMFTQPHGQPMRFYDFTDQTNQIVPVGHELMPSNGHNTYLAGDYGDWILNDTYPDTTRRQTVYLFHVQSGRRFDLGKFPSPRQYTDEWRCDTHPRCSADGTMVAIDSPHEGGRQVHLLDIRELLQKHS